MSKAKALSLARRLYGDGVETITNSAFLVDCGYPRCEIHRLGDDPWNITLAGGDTWDEVYDQLESELENRKAVTE